MADPPFSARNRGAHRQIDGNFPASARNGLLHLLFGLIERRYIDGWRYIARELQRIGRLPPVEYSDSHVASLKQAKLDAQEVLLTLEWDKTYDFCERLHNHLACNVGYSDRDGEFIVHTQKSEVQAFIADELQRLFAEEGLAFEFVEGLVRRRGRKHTVDVTTSPRRAQ